MSSRLALALLAGSLLFGCADAEQITPPPPASTTAAEHTVAFAGYVYDALTGARLTDYSIEIQTGGEPIEGSVEEGGRYLTGNISPWDDFTISISNGDEYRTFRSHNGAIGLPAELAQSNDISASPTHQTLLFDAYLVPSSLQAPAVTFTMVKAGVAGEPSGSIRVRAASPSVLAEDEDTPEGVEGQLWINDEDLQAPPITGEFDGEFTIPAGDLLYGVTYQVDIYNVDGYQPFSDNYKAGIEADKTFTLQEEVTEPLALVASDHETCPPPPSALSTEASIVTIQLNDTIELHDDGDYPGGPAEAIDDGISISSSNDDGDSVTNTLKSDDSTGVQERRVTLGTSGNQLTIRWNPSLGLQEPDPNDPITLVQYSNLGAVSVRRTGAPSSAISLSTLLGTSTINCQ